MIRNTPMEPLSPSSPPPPPVSPFTPRPPAAPGRSGCSKPLIIGCGVIFLLAAISAIVGFYLLAKNVDTLLVWAGRELAKQMPPDVTPEEKERFEQAMAEFSSALKEQRVDRVRLQTVQSKLMEASRKGNKLTRQDVLELTLALEQAVLPPAPSESSSGP